jgi:hypothetical protein
VRLFVSKLALVLFELWKGDVNSILLSLSIGANDNARTKRRASRRGSAYRSVLLAAGSSSWSVLRLAHGIGRG